MFARQTFRSEDRRHINIMRKALPRNRRKLRGSLLLVQSITPP
jgi:hypothetical protein